MDIYYVLEELIKVKEGASLSDLFIGENGDKLDSDNDRKIFNILKNISSMTLEISKDEGMFVPSFVFGNERSFDIHDMTESDYDLLYNIDLSKLPVNLRARVSDVLWIHKKDHTIADVAHKSYYELFNLWFNEEDYTEALDMIERAIYIAAKINNKDSHNKYCQTIYEHIVRIDGKDEKFLTISLIKIILKQSFGDLNKIVHILNNSISLSVDNPFKTESLYLLKIECLNKMKDRGAVKQANVELGEYFLQYGENIVKQDEKGAMRSEKFFHKAIQLFKNNDKNDKAKKAHIRLIEVQKKIPDMMSVHSIPFDAKK